MRRFCHKEGSGTQLLDEAELHVDKRKLLAAWNGFSLPTWIVMKNSSKDLDASRALKYMDCSDLDVFWANIWKKPHSETSEVLVPLYLFFLLGCIAGACCYRSMEHNTFLIPAIVTGFMGLVYCTLRALAISLAWSCGNRFRKVPEGSGKLFRNVWGRVTEKRLGALR